MISHFSELPYRTFQNSHIALFRTMISHFSELPYRTFQNSHIALFRTPISHFSQLRYRTFEPHIGFFAGVRYPRWGEFLKRAQESRVAHKSKKREGGRALCSRPHL